MGKGRLGSVRNVLGKGLPICDPREVAPLWEPSEEEQGAAMDPSWPSSVSSETLATRPRAYARGWWPRGPALPRALGSGRGDAEARVGASLWNTAGRREEAALRA